MNEASRFCELVTISHNAYPVAWPASCASSGGFRIRRAAKADKSSAWKRIAAAAAAAAAVVPSAQAAYIRRSSLH